jgi:THO complex subunit 2
MGPPLVAKLEEVADADMSAFAPLDLVVVEQDTPGARNKRAAAVWEHLLALIGYFDLETNRVLDIILDLFVSNVSLHYPFFLALLRASPWAQDRGKGKADETISPEGKDEKELRWMHEEQGNSTCAHILGFKLQWHARESSVGETPYEMLLVAALLIRHGFVRTKELWHHVYSEQAMKDAQAAFVKSLDDKVAEASSNPLAMAGALLEDDGDGQTGAKKAEEKPKAVKIPQVIGLTKAFLALGMLDHATFVVARWPWLLAAEEDMAIMYCRLLRPTIRSAYELVVPLAERESMKLSTEGNCVPFQPERWDAKKGCMSRLPPPRAHITTLAPPPPDSPTKRHAFFYSAWREQLPKYQSKEDVFASFPASLRLAGYNLHLDPKLLQLVARITAAGFAAQPGFDESGRNPWIDVLRNHLFPACSLGEANVAILAELWTILSQLPYWGRFTLYGEWKYSLYRKKELKHCQALTEKEAKGVLKRISSDARAQRAIGRKLAKAAHPNPTIFFTIALNQVQAYDNLIGPLVEAARYLTSMETDIFTFTLLDGLSNPEKQRMKKDGTNLAQWLKSLAAFAGTLYRRYPAMDCGPVLQYIVNQLHLNNSNDLVVIRELVLKMTGIEPLTNPADRQLAASVGGRLLKREATMANDGTHGSAARTAYRKDGERLMHTLRGSGMMLPLLILVAQQRDACIHLVEEDSEAHLKFLGTLYDTCQEVLFQYVEFLATYLDPDTYSASVPEFGALRERFKIQPEIAFHIVRPQLSLRVKKMERNARSEALRKQVLESRNSAAESKNESDDKGATKQDEGEDIKMVDAAEEDIAVQKVEASEDTVMQVVNGSVKKEEKERKDDPEESWWKGALTSVEESALQSLPAAVTRIMTPNFYVTFWQLSLSDIEVPVQRYESEVDLLLKTASSIKDIHPERTEQARRPLTEASKAMEAEAKDQQEGQKYTMKRLEVESRTWFRDGSGSEDIAIAMLQHCIYPRTLLSPVDAIFSAKFVRLLQNLRAPWFSSLAVYGQVRRS